MTVASDVSKTIYDGNGSTYQFSTVFSFEANVDVLVTYTNAAGVETTWVEGTHYTLTGAGTGVAGQVDVKTTPTDYTPPTGTNITVSRDMSFTQLVDYTPGAAFPADTHESALDKLTQIAQQLKEEAGRVIGLPISSTLTPSFPLPGAGDFIRWNTGGTDLEAVDINSALTASTAVTAYMETVLLAATADAARKLLDVRRPNILMNTALRSWQDGTSFVAAANGTWFADVFRLTYAKTAGAINVERGSSAGDYPTVAEGGSGNPYSMEITANGNVDVSGASDAVVVYQRVTGFNYYKIHDGKANFSIVGKATVAGQYGVYVRVWASGAQTAVYTTYINLTTSFAVHGIGIDLAAHGVAVSGGEEIALEIGICLAGKTGGNLEAPLTGTWYPGTQAYYYPAGQTNGLATSGNKIYLSDWLLTEGEDRLGWADHENPDEHLRHYWVWNSEAVTQASLGVGWVQDWATTANTAHTVLRFPVKMRAAPSVTFDAASNYEVVYGSLSAAAGTIGPNEPTSTDVRVSMGSIVGAPLGSERTVLMRTKTTSAAYVDARLV